MHAMAAFLLVSTSCLTRTETRLVCSVQCNAHSTTWRSQRRCHGHGRITSAAEAVWASAASDPSPEEVSAPIPSTSFPKQDNLTKSASSSTPRRFQFVSWATVERLTAQLAENLRGQRFDVVLAVTRGGMVPATLLAQAMELRNVVTATAIFYTDGGDQFFGMTEPRFLAFPAADALAGRNVLIVDDVWDSGRTATAVKRRVELAAPKSIAIAVLHYKPTQTVVRDSRPDYYAEIADDWLVYPWERNSPHLAGICDKENWEKDIQVQN